MVAAAGNSHSVDDETTVGAFVADEGRTTEIDKQISFHRKLSVDSNISSVDGDSPPAEEAATSDHQNTIYMDCMYVSSFAVIGATLRLYMARLFGADCEMGGDAIQDVVTPFFQGICVTAGGRSAQTGGALFRELPVNMLGSFFMGLITSNSRGFFLPWFHKEHHLQKYKPFQVGYGVGFCGSLTTFAAWNSQMVVMMDGTYAELGSQIAPAIFGYLLGMTTCISSFRIGNDFAELIHSKWGTHEEPETRAAPLRDPHDWNSWTPMHRDSEIQSSKRQPMRNQHVFRPIHFVHVFSLFILTMLCVGTLVYDNPFYERVAMAAIAAPFGALCRWKLSKWNDSQYLTQFPMPWLPWGTLAANIIAALIAVACQGVVHRYLEDVDERRWTEGILFAVHFGFAGSLSTVSTLVKEIVALGQQETNRWNSSLYGALTCFCGMALGLTVYMSIVRS